MPKIVDHDAYREQILEGCYELFAREGYAAITLRRLSKELGISTGAIYHYFESKEAIFEQTVAYIARQELSSAILEVQSGTTREERLLSLVRFLHEHDERLRLLLMLIFDFSRQSVSAADSDIFSIALNTYVDAIIANLPEIPAEDARFVVDMLLGTVVRRVLIRNDDDFDAHMRWLVPDLPESPAPNSSAKPPVSSD